jgi:hypothetical protein
MTKNLGLLISLGFFSTVALAQGKPDPLEACYQQPDGAPRLACFNKEMQHRQGAAASGRPIPPTGATAIAPSAPVAAASKPAADTVGLQGSALRKKLKDEGVKPEATQPIVAKIVRLVPRSHSLQAFVLDNGQAWEQAESMDNLDVKLDDTVTIKPGILGAFFLNTPRSQHVRVHRIL